MSNEQVMQVKYRDKFCTFTTLAGLDAVCQETVLRYAPKKEGFIPGVCNINGKNIIGYVLPNMSFQPK